MTGLRLSSPAVAFASLTVLSLAAAGWADEPVLPGIGSAMREMIRKKEVSGAVTVVVAKERVLHPETTGLADIGADRPMSPDTLFWIASMTKPVTGTAVLMLQDEGKLNVADPVEKYLPEFGGLKTPSGQPPKLTITPILTPTSSWGEADGPAARQAKTLSDLVPRWRATPMPYEPGTHG